VEDRRIVELFEAVGVQVPDSQYDFPVTGQDQEAAKKKDGAVDAEFEVVDE